VLPDAVPNSNQDNRTEGTLF